MRRHDGERVTNSHLSDAPFWAHMAGSISGPPVSHVNTINTAADWLFRQNGLERAKVVLLGHSYVRRLGEYMEHSQQPMVRNADVTVAGYGGTTVARLRRRLSSNVLANADVVFVHIGEND